MKGLIIKITDM